MLIVNSIKEEIQEYWVLQIGINSQSHDITPHPLVPNPQVQAPNSSASNPSEPNSPEPSLSSYPPEINNEAKIKLLEADIDNLQSKVHEPEAVIHRLRAEICLKESQIKSRKIHF